MIALPTRGSALCSSGMSQGRSSKEEEFFAASHEVLFEQIAALQCDACGEQLVAEDEDGDALAGSGAYLWKRGDGITVEKVPLCASCASAIGMAALARWEIEEEEG